MADVIITLPKDNNWKQYLEELKVAEERNEVLNFKISKMPNVVAGDRCFIVYDGFIRGFNYIRNVEVKEFVCTTSGDKWSGLFLVRDPQFFHIELIEMQGFQGWRYFNEKKLPREEYREDLENYEINIIKFRDQINELIDKYGSDVLLTIEGYDVDAVTLSRPRKVIVKP